MNRNFEEETGGKRDQEVEEKGLSDMAECMSPNRRVPSTGTSQKIAEKREI